MCYPYKENWFEIRSNTNVIYACFILHNYVNEEVVKSQIEILKMNEESYKNIPDPTFSLDCVEGTITRKKITQYTKDRS